MKRFIKMLIPAVQKEQFGVSGDQNSPSIPVFDKPHYVDITEARLSHLKFLELPVAGKKVIDVGCGIGRLSEFFANQGCDTFCIDGRFENIKILKELYPERKAAVVDLETSQILEYGKFDIVFCYGLLYHLADTFGFIKNAFRICNEMMIIETCITDANDPVLLLVKEQQNKVTQAVSGIGSRPSPSYVVACLYLAGFKYVYTPVELPNHKQFKYKRVDDFSHLRDGEPIRDIFIASHKKIPSSKLRLCSQR